ncbi:oligoendopeptidase F [Anaeromicrobium sediminis]|uniref:Oligopeptidase F n=1 Tax=Anaeromicrobium sediminis TaxID=1478221 RepID=A0A267MIL0_9FIRM|nr:oligoendopeptidase F [Anaeromicrobium sediminis]PAB58633.1 oligoendopeptidase F [Anaeromicrobium sediminis]
MKSNNENAIPKRSEIEDKYKWNLEKMYSSKDEWEKDIETIREKANEITQYAEKLGESADSLYTVLNLDDEISRKLENVFVYARMKKDEDNRVTEYQAMSDKAQSVVVEVQSKLSFITPELTQIPEETVHKYMKEDERLSVYGFFFDELFRQKKHILSKNEENLLAQMGEISSAPKSIFSMINNADIKFGTIIGEEGKEVEVTQGRYTTLLKSTDRRVRKDAFEALYKSYEAQKNTIASTLGYSVKKDVFYAKARKYKSALDASLSSDNIPLSVYDNLIDTVESHLPSMYKYMELRKAALKVDELHMYDLYTPIVKEMKAKIPFEEGKELVKDGLAPLGKEYMDILQKGFDEGWIDVYENEGKTSGAYSFGSYESAPYVLLNYQNTINDVFTLAHEMGHSLHSYYTRSTQPYTYGSYKIFVAEVASTVNESLLMNHLLKTTTDKEKRKYLLNHYLEQFRGTIYRQTMFAKFEKMTHEMVEKGQALTTDTLCDMYRHLNKKYFGDNIVIDDLIKMEWARIPHFYNAFYVYKYATGFSAAISLSNQILNDGQGAVDKYINFLKSGGSDYPINQLKKAGVDMTKTEPIDSALKTFGKLVDEMEQLI